MGNYVVGGIAGSCEWELSLLLLDMDPAIKLRVISQNVKSGEDLNTI